MPMRFDMNVLDETELIAYALRELYMQAGYRRYRMSKFEEYDLYSRNKSFLGTDEIVTFTDTNGKLMALKPDVTLSIIRNTPDGEGAARLCYNENVYRAAKGGPFKEIMQTGVECIGGVDASCVSEVVALAARSLSILGPRWALAVSDVDLLGAFARRAGLEDESDLVFALAAQKNLHEIRALCRRKVIAADQEEALIGLLSVSCPVLKAPERIGSLCARCGVKEDIRVLKAVMDRLEAEGLSQNVQLDFSCAGDMRYYNGIIFKGYIEGVSQSGLSGGQYDSLMRRMGKKGGAAGFAVYLDRLERLERAGGDRC